MRRAVIFGVAALVVVAGCGSPVAGEAQAPGGDTSLAPSVASSTVAAVPPSPRPAGNGPCPYLTNAFVEDANGQRVSRVRTSVDQPYPACFFYRSDGKVQLSTYLFLGDAPQAKALVDASAPVTTANPAELAGGWTGGAQSTAAGAVFAVAKGGVALVINTNQAQTIKAKRVAEKVIAALDL